MIVGLIKELTAIEVLHEAPSTFYLGGSRQMAEWFKETYQDCDPLVQGACPQFNITVNEDTDYDFYATHSPELQDYLVDNGFDVSSIEEHYFDTECISILCRDSVQVVLRRDADFYRDVFANIDLAVYYHYLWKSSPEKPNRALIGNIFNMLFAIAHATKGV